MSVNLRKNNKRLREPIAEINVTPFVDAMLVLLIIFMVTAPLLTSGIKVNLPESSKKVLSEKKEPVTVTINNKGQIIKSLKNNETGNIEYRLPITEKKGGNKNDLIFFVLLFTYCFIFFIYKKND